MMEVNLEQQNEEAIFSPGNDMDEYREAVRRVIDAEVKKSLEEEMQKASKELIEEQRSAIRQILEEHKAAIRQVVEEEKKAIWEKAEALRKSILKLGI
jgi:ATP-dependent Zn protease